MKDHLISRNRFLEKLVLDADRKTDIILVHQALEAAVVDPDEVRGVGEWIDCPSTHIQDGAKYRMCSVCNEHIAVLGHDLNYCPNCGARMKGADPDAATE